MTGVNYSFERYVQDVQDNAAQLLGRPHFQFKGKGEIKFFVPDIKTVNASATKTANNQYTILIHKELLRECFKEVNTSARLFAKNNSAMLNVGEEQFVRTVCGVASEMIFWHEFAHVARGHIEYLKDRGCSDGTSITELQMNGDEKSVAECSSQKRFVEIDADIYGAQFLFGRVLTVLRTPKNSISATTWICAFVLGIRCMYEVLHKDGLYDYFVDATATHPAPMIRSHIAVAHGLSAAVRLGLPDNHANAFVEWGRVVLLQHETGGTAVHTDLESLQRFIDGELQFWQSNETGLRPYQLLELARPNLLQSVLKKLIGS